MSSWLSQCSEISLGFLGASDAASFQEKMLSGVLLEKSHLISEGNIKCSNVVNKVIKEFSHNDSSCKKFSLNITARCLSFSEKRMHFGASSTKSSQSQASKSLSNLLFGPKNFGKFQFAKIQGHLPEKYLSALRTKTKDSGKKSYDFDSKINRTIKFSENEEGEHSKVKPELQPLSEKLTSKKYFAFSRDIEKAELIATMLSDLKHSSGFGDKEGKDDQSDKESQDLEHCESLNRVKKTHPLNLQPIPSFKWWITNNPKHATKTQNQKPTPEEIIPVLPLPNTGLFALYYILTKQGILSDFSAYATYKEDMDFNQKEIETTYTERLEQLRETIDKEDSVKRWGVLGKFFSWMTAFLGSISGIILIFSGIGSIMGAGLLAAGLFGLVNSLVEWTGGWNEIANLLPGNNVNKKRAVLSWMKIGISIICLVLSLITCFATGGISVAMRAAQAVPQVIVTILLSGFGAAIIGEAVSSFKLFHSISEVKNTERHLEMLYHSRQDLNERAQSDVESIEMLFDALVSALNLDREIAQVDAIFYR